MSKQALGLKCAISYPSAGEVAARPFAPCVSTGSVTFLRWDMFYTNAAAKGMQLEKWDQQLISITGSCNQRGSAVLYNFFYSRPQGMAALSLSEPGDGSDVFLSYKQKDGTDGLATKLFYELKPKEVILLCAGVAFGLGMGVGVSMGVRMAGRARIG